MVFRAHSSEVEVKDTGDGASKTRSQENIQPGGRVLDDEPVNKGPNALSNSWKDDENAGLWEFSSGFWTVLSIILDEQKGWVKEGCRTYSIDDEKYVLIGIVTRWIKYALDGIDCNQNNEGTDEFDSNIDWNTEQAHVIILIQFDLS